MLLVGASEVRAVLDTNVLRRALASGYAALSEGRADVPTRIMAHTATGLLGAMPGYVEGIGLAAKLVSVFPGNSEHDLPTHMAVVVLFDETTGMPLALIDGEVITEMRTSASAALACELLAPAEAEVLTIVGAGVQAAGHLTAFRSVRPWTAIRVANRTPERARRLAERFGDVTAVDDIDEAVSGADVVACTTDAPSAVFDPAAFTGSHLSSVGIHHELPDSLLRGAVVAVQTRAGVTTPPPNGPAAVQGMNPEDVVELGEVIKGRRQGRSNPEQVTAWVSVGHAMEDVVAARLSYDEAVAAGLGMTIGL
jgi:ornithine cyclodeaminase